MIGRIIQVEGTVFNRLIFDAYDYINGELIRRESALPIPPRDYYYNILTGRWILAGSRRYYELICANWNIEEDYYLILPWMEDDVVQEFINGDRGRNLLQRERPVTYEDIMDRHENTLVKLNITLCKNCLISIKKENDTNTEYCEDCISTR